MKGFGRILTVSDHRRLNGRPVDRVVGYELDGSANVLHAVRGRDLLQRDGRVGVEARAAVFDAVPVDLLRHVLQARGWVVEAVWVDGAAGGDGAGEGAGERGVWAGYALRGHGADAVMGGRGGVDGGVVHHERPVQKLDDVWSPDVAWDAGPGAEGGQRVVAAVDAAGGEVGGGCKLDVDARWVTIRAYEGVPGATDFGNTGVHPVGGDDGASSGAGRDGGGNGEEEGEEGGDCGKHGER